MSVIHNDLLLSTDEATGYNLTKSLRFRSSASAYLNRTPASAGNRRTWTWSGWVKIGLLTSGGMLFSGGTGAGTELACIYDSGNQTLGFTASNIGDIRTNATFRDPSAWYHIVVQLDTTQATASNRAKIYINGVLQTWNGTPFFSQNTDYAINNNVIQVIGARGNVTSPFDGYMTEVNFVDGQALTPSSFGETDAITGVWKPKRYTGTYGTNGFYLPFTDVATTSGSNAGLGKDFSGNGNYWNTNNISVTAGATYDSMTDVPTLTSATAANYAVLNPLDVSGSGITLSNGNLNATCSTGSIYYFAKASQAIPTSGGFYWETTISTIGQFPIVGIQPTSRNNVNSGSVYLGYYSDEISWFGGLNEIYQNGVNILSVSSASAGDVIMVAHNAGKTWIGKNGTWFNSGDPSAGTGNLGSTLSGQLSASVCLRGTTAPIVNANFGQQGFVYTPPTGFKALNTYNLPDSTIVAGNKVMDATTYTGNGSTQTITNAGAMKPDLIWLKSRSNAYNNFLTNSVAGASKYLISNATDAEADAGSAGITAFNTNGFSMGSGTALNGSGATYVGWQWQAGQGTTSSNTSGSITSTVSVNATAGFSIVTYTGTGANATVGHGLGVAPSMVIVKNRTTGTSDVWLVQHSSLGATKYIILNRTDAVGTASTAWNDTAPTSSVFSLGSLADVNRSTNTYVAYCWSEIAGFSKFGSYTGNGSADGTFVYTGFKPKFIMVKCSSSSQGGAADWIMLDTSRDSFNIASKLLYADLSNAEETYNITDILSNGFKQRNTYPSLNSSGATYIYMAFAENPFKNSLAR